MREVMRGETSSRSKKPSCPNPTSLSGVRKIKTLTLPGKATQLKARPFIDANVNDIKASWGDYKDRVDTVFLTFSRLVMSLSYCLADRMNAPADAGSS